MKYGKHFPIMENMTVREVRGYLAERPSVILGLGVIEQHGYHLPLCTDALMAREFTRRVGERIGMLVAPTIHMSFSGGQLPGTININPNVMGLLVAETLRSLAAQGFRNIFMLLCHGGSENARSLDNALKLLLRDDPSFKNVMLVLAPEWKFSETWLGSLDEGDWHAGWLETSIIMALAPDLVQIDKMELDAPEVVADMRLHPDNYQRAHKPVDHEFVVPRMAQRPEVRVGAMGDPAKASVELGRQIAVEVVDGVSDLFVKLERDRAEEYREVAWTPEPIIL